MLFSLVVVAADTDEFYVSDGANVLSEETKKFILSYSNDLCLKTQAQIVVVSVKDMGGKNERDYAIELARSLKIGGKDDNGILIFLALSERKIDVEVGYGLEGAIPDSKAGRLIDNYALPYFKEDDFDNGILNLYKSILKEVYSEYDLEVPEEVASGLEQNASDEVSLGVIIIFLILIAVTVIIMIIFFSGSGKNGQDNNHGDSVGGFLGGYYAGSRFGSGKSSGNFGSGGFGSSRGGGGSFGGGGASRGF